MFLRGRTLSSSSVLDRNVSGVTSTASFLCVPQSRSEWASTAAPVYGLAVVGIWVLVCLRYLEDTHRSLRAVPAVSMAESLHVEYRDIHTVQYTSSLFAMVSRSQLECPQERGISITAGQQRRATRASVTREWSRLLACAKSMYLSRSSTRAMPAPCKSNFHVAIGALNQILVIDFTVHVHTGYRRHCDT